MLIKEYRIPLPLTVEEYRIAQLYMIAKKSREESRGAGSGVEILVNDPYEDGPGGNGQYTHKIYHVGSHLPSWLKSLLPRSVLCVEEEAWNCYPYTKTRYTCPFVEKFLLEIETYYFPDRGNQENVFRLSGSELRNRIVDLIDIVNDQLHGGDYTQDEDPKLFFSFKTKRGPLSDHWIDEYWSECKDQPMPRPNGMSIMCAYKLCRVEFRYWGMQTKLEKFIHDTALRKTMLRAHRQAWAWQDEWYGLTMEDIRQIEKETQEELKLTMGGGSECDEEEEISHKKGGDALAATLGSIEKPELETGSPTRLSIDQQSPQTINSQQKPTKDRSTTYQTSPTNTLRLNDINSSNWRMDMIVSDSDTKSDNGDEFFDCTDDLVSLGRWSSLNQLNGENDYESPFTNTSHDDRMYSQSHQKYSERTYNEDSSNVSFTHTDCSISYLILVLHGGSILDALTDMNAKKSDLTTFRGTIENVIRAHYPNLIGHVAVKLVCCPSICAASLNILSSLSPYSFDVSPMVADNPHVAHDSMPIAAIPLLSLCTPDYNDAVIKTIQAANSVYNEFIHSDEGKGFAGKVTIVGDSIGSILAYDALSKSRRMGSEHRLDDDSVKDVPYETEHGAACDDISHQFSPNSDVTASSDTKLCFEAGEFFMFGSPLSLILTYRELANRDDKSCRVRNPGVQQAYNLFHPSDPMSSRLEPVLNTKFTFIPPISVPRYQKFPLGNGQLYHLFDVMQGNSQMFGTTDNGVLGLTRKPSIGSLQSITSGIMDSVPENIVKSLSEKWWGSKRLDYALYCPEGLTNFPTYALPHLFHASYWESPDVIAFLLRQMGKFELANTIKQEDQDASSYNQSHAREKWVRKRTSVKIKNVAANHRANDVVVKEGLPQVLAARFMYGPLDMITLTGEKVDIFVMTDITTSCWLLLGTEITDKNGRVSFQIPKAKTLGYGLHPVKMVVRGDQSFVEFSLAVIPPLTECVVFSIDGSFTASVSVTGRDPKVRACAVDVVRHWQELGFLILYITGRPDIQQSQVLSWLSQHNFPLGLVSFADGLSTDPLGHKAFYLKSLIQDHEMIIHAAYGSNKDISVYSSLGLNPSQIYIVGKVSKKHHSQATVLSEGYATHLTNMSSRGRSRQAQGNARMVLGARANNASIRYRGWSGGSNLKLDDV